LFILFLGCANSHSEDLRSLLEMVRRGPHMKSFDPQAEDKFFKNVHAITDSGTNAEAYWSFDGKNFSFQAIRNPLAATHPCDQIYTMGVDGSSITLQSGGTGRTTCSYYFPDGKSIIYSQTTLQKPCPPAPDMNFGYVWPIYHDMKIFVQDLKSGTKSLIPTGGSNYEAESTISPDGKRIIFTSARDGDLELYTMDLDGNNVQRMTYTPGYDGGAYFSSDSKQMVWRANRPHGEDLMEYFRLLEYGLVAPVGMQIYIQDVSLVTPAIQLTNNKATNFAPFFLPDNSGVIFSSNLVNPMGGTFHLYVADLQGNITQVTTQGNFNAFPMFSPDGKKIAWCSDRDTKQPGDINVLIADWVGPGGVY